MENDGYRIIGAEASPYSVKVRSYFRYKRIPHRWETRTPAMRDELAKLVKLPLIPVVLTPQGEALQDSTPIVEELERRHPEPPLQPEDRALAFVSTLIEELADEWGNKWMFHYRWARDVDQRAAAARIVGEVMPDLPEDQREAAVETLRQRMVSRVWFVGSSERTAPIIERSFVEALDALDAHLESRPYLLGARPALADLGLWGQLVTAASDPTPGALVAERAAVGRWLERMKEPRAEGPFERWSELAPTLEPFLARQAGGHFLPWSVANARAVESGEETFAVELAGGVFEQKPQKYHAKSLAALGRHYRAAASPELDAILARTGCLDALRAMAGSPSAG